MFVIKGKGRAETFLGFDDFFLLKSYLKYFYLKHKMFLDAKKISMRCFGCLTSNKKIEKKV